MHNKPNPGARQVTLAEDPKRFTRLNETGQEESGSLYVLNCWHTIRWWSILCASLQLRKTWARVYMFSIGFLQVIQG